MLSQGGVTNRNFSSRRTQSLLEAPRRQPQQLAGVVRATPKPSQLASARRPRSAVAQSVSTRTVPQVVAWVIPPRTAKDRYMMPRPMSITPPSLRRERLRDALPGTMAMINADRVDLIPYGFVDDYVALSWLEERGAGLRLTRSGAALCRYIAERSPFPRPLRSGWVS